MNTDYGLDPTQFLRYIVRPTLDAIGYRSPAADPLVLGTALVESRLRYVDQIDPASKPGPAYGLYEMEEPTHTDLWLNFLPSNGALVAAISRLSSYASHPPPVTDLRWNLQYATAMCRAQYLRASPPLPSPLDAMGLAKYHKIYYNTLAGASVVTETVLHFNFAVRLCLNTR